MSKNKLEFLRISLIALGFFRTFCYADFESQSFVTVSNDGWLRLWNKSDSAKIFQGLNSLTCVEIIPLNRLALGSSDGLIYIFDLVNKSEIKTLSFHHARVNDILNLKNETIYSLDTNYKLIKWNATSYERIEIENIGYIGIPLFLKKFHNFILCVTSKEISIRNQTSSITIHSNLEEAIESIEVESNTSVQFESFNSESSYWKLNFPSLSTQKIDRYLFKKFDGNNSAYKYSNSTGISFKGIIVCNAKAKNLEMIQNDVIAVQCSNGLFKLVNISDGKEIYNEKSLNINQIRKLQLTNSNQNEVFQFSETNSVTTQQKLTTEVYTDTPALALETGNVSMDNLPTNTSKLLNMNYTPFFLHIFYSKKDTTKIINEESSKFTQSSSKYIETEAHTRISSDHSTQFPETTKKNADNSTNVSLKNSFSTIFDLVGESTQIKSDDSAQFSETIINFSGTFSDTTFSNEEKLKNVSFTLYNTYESSTDLMVSILDLKLEAFEFKNQSSNLINDFLVNNFDMSNCLTNCSNHGSCSKTGNKFSCQCFENFAGSSCEIDLRSCSSNPCLNNGTCVEEERNSFSCKCDLFYYGFYCQNKVNVCENETCSSNGQCYDIDNKPKCNCFYAYVGEKCDLKTNEKILIERGIKISVIIALIAIFLVGLGIVLIDIANIFIKPQKDNISKRKCSKKLVHRPIYIQ
ncbi:unnamed protein product [Brachionus calyciflorus]|uniref:EGF-like domain-containing protein n=1 Tax=Brachionus calyciflorus TaxID=104777 RepID=A0A813V2P4_9BILA|nr:unnamed protein product [Brachionus calyciflorus]